MFDFKDTPKRKSTKAGRVKKLAAKVAKLEKKKALDAMEIALKKKLNQLKK